MYSSRKMFKKLSLLLVLLMTVTLLTSVASVNAADSPADSAVQFLQNDYTEKGINNCDTGVGSYALYVLTQAGVDAGTWLFEGDSLKDAVISAISGDISNAADPTNVSAKLLAQDLAAARALGQNELADQIVQILQNRQSSAGFDAGPYSDIPAYDLLGRVGLIDEINKEHAKDCILGAQNTTVDEPDCGSFGGTFDEIFYPDFMTTAQAVRALNYLNTAKSDAQIQTAINNGLDWIQKQQQADGSFKAGDWDDPVIDTSEVIVTLKTLGMDPATWKSSEDKSAVDYLMNDALNADGSFGTSQNAMDATWALCAYNLLDIHPGGEVSETEKTVGLAVVGTSGELLYGPSNVTVAETNKWGLTALGALDASGTSYHTSSWSYGVYVDSIGGQANSGMAGWMYVVNGQMPSVGADNYNIDNNDKIIFYYSKSMEQQPPQWDELVPEDTQFYLDPASVTLNAGDKHQLTALWEVAAGTTDVTKYAQWSVADDSIAGVDSSGLVTALKAGRTVVNAVYGGFTASADLTVNSSGSGGGGGGDNSRSVGLAVVGTSGELLYGPSNVTVAETNKWGLTALGALDASGISYHTSSWSYGYLIDSIGGQANSGMSGWMYVVNGQIPSVGAEKHNINKNDKIIFYYSKSMDQQPPKWDELGKKQTSGGAGGGGQPANLPVPVSDTALNTAVRNAGTAGLVALQADNTQKALALSSDQLTKISNTGKPLAVTVQGVQFVLSVDSLKVPELMAADTAHLQVKAQKLSSGDVQSLMESFAGKWKPAGDVYELNVLAVNKDGTQKNIEQFPDCKVLLPVPEALREAAEAGKIMAYRYNENSKVWEELGGTYDKTSGSMSFKTEHFSKYALLETVYPTEVSAGKTFKDIAGHWAQKEIEFMATEGYVAGVGDNEFAPEITVTRAEFATILARMAGLTANPGGAERFNDVPDYAWYRGTVGAAANVGLVYGMGENSFAPSKSITREQMAAMMVRLMAKDGLNMTISDADAANLLADFNDAAGISSWACTSVALMAKEQLMVGRENGQFVPLGETTRAEAAVVLYRVLQKLPQSGK